MLTIVCATRANSYLSRGNFLRNLRRTPLRGVVSVSAQESIVIWQVKAACRGPQSAVFFPPPHFERKADRIKRERRAKAICQQCTVQDACLEYSISIEEPHGIWGGLNEAERKSLMLESELGSLGTVTEMPKRVRA